MELAQIEQLVRDGKLEYVKIGTPDMEGVYRGKRVDATYFLHALNDGFAQCDVLFGWDIAENVLPNLRFSNWERGFADLVMRPDLSTFALVPWEEHVASCICDLWTEAGEPVKLSPRYLLNQLVERARSLGYNVAAAAELEFRLFRESQVSLREKDFGPNLTPLNPGMNCYAISQASADDHLLGRIARMMRDYGIALEGYNREHGPGMYEMNLRYQPALVAADYTMLFKTGIKEICYQMGYAATFMAKWHDQEDGSSGHSHMSLWDLDMERNLFWDEEAEGHMSATMRHFLAGVLESMPGLMALYAPTINSYKRYVVGTWTPLNTTWGWDNRTCAVRVINNGPRAIRIENRVPGADANFYLVFAAMLAGGLYGIERKLELGPALRGNAYDPATIARAAESAPIHSLARNLTTATDLFEQSEVAREYFGSEFVEHFAATRRWEVSEFERAVTNWERRRYFELI
ncbi:glutamine synthetase [Thermogemmatispora aurantia]|jgi:glutamine synthetase|uniref:Glutamine synthetase n=1 Tax=Thermogemmatispora aurantia TaxID=2045279 RepID=A0A5J4K3V3_9CHLR|nr:glutamine synthetase family protein [Thermogemmatispora aurantia]GER82245.1 glutamine synthetase [Thermogemmatispora aurantia]